MIGELPGKGMNINVKKNKCKYSKEKDNLLQVLFAEKDLSCRSINCLNERDPLFNVQELGQVMSLEKRSITRRCKKCNTIHSLWLEAKKHLTISMWYKERLINNGRL